MTETDLERKSKYSSYNHVFNVHFLSLLIKNTVKMSAGIPNNTHKQYGDTVFPSNVSPLQAGWALRAEEEKHGKSISLPWPIILSFLSCQYVITYLMNKHHRNFDSFYFIFHDMIFV